MTATLVGVVVAIALLIASNSVQRSSEATARRGLEQSADLVAQFLSGRERSLAGGASVFVQGPYFRTLVSERRSDDILDQTFEAVSQLESQWVSITDARGVLLAKSDEPAVRGDELGGVPLIAGALRGKVTAGFGVSHDSLLFQAVAVPIVIPGGILVGALIATRLVDSLLAHDVRAATASEVVFFTRAVDGTIRVAASTLGRDAAVLSAVRRLTALPSGGMASNVPQPGLRVDSIDYLAQRASLTTAGGEVVGGFVVLRSRDVERSGLAGVQRSIVLAGVIGFLLTLVVAYAAARRIARPVRVLADAVQRAADGDYHGTVAHSVLGSSAGAEVTELAEAFDSLLTDLRDKEALIAMRVANVAVRSEALSPADDPGARRGRRLRLAGGIFSIPDPHPHAGARPGIVMQPGSILANRYRIDALLGSGGMGMVYRAFDRTLSDTVAVKLLRPEVVVADADAYAHFKQELRLARRVTHRNVVRTHDLGESDGVPFITMEFVDGKSLAEIIRARGALSTTVVVAIAKQLLRALVAAHAQQVVHGDLKPQNLLIGPNGVLKVSDFGVARLVRDPWRGALPRDANDAAENTSRLRGAVIGTPEYMAPEQLIGGSATVQSDIYAAGIVLHECVSGTTPYRADTPMAFFAHKLDTPVSTVTPDSHAPTMRAPRASNSVVKQIIAHMTAHDVGSRPISASVLLARFSRVL